MYPVYEMCAACEVLNAYGGYTAVWGIPFGMVRTLTQEQARQPHFDASVKGGGIPPSSLVFAHEVDDNGREEQYRDDEECEDDLWEEAGQEALEGREAEQKQEGQEAEGDQTLQTPRSLAARPQVSWWKAGIRGRSDQPGKTQPKPQADKARKGRAQADQCQKAEEIHEKEKEPHASRS